MQTVTMLSRKPSDPKLLNKVHKLVKEAQADRKNMEKDHRMLSALEQVSLSIVFMVCVCVCLYLFVCVCMCVCV